MAEETTDPRLLTKLPKDLYPFIFRYLENIDIRSVSWSCKLFHGEGTGVAEKYLEKRKQFHEMLEKQWLCSRSNVIEDNALQENTPIYSKLYQLASHAPDVFRDLFSNDNAQAWIIAAINGNLIQLNALLGDDLRSAKDVHHQAGVAQYLLMSGDWSKIVMLLNQKKISVDAFLDEDLCFFAAVGGHFNYCQTLKSFSEKDNEGNYRILDADTRHKLSTIQIPEHRKYHFAAWLIQFGYLDECYQYLDQGNIKFEIFKEKHPKAHLAAAKNNHWKVCDVLIKKHGFDPNAVNSDNASLLHLAAFTDQKNRFIKMIKEDGMNLMPLDNWELNPLLHAIKGGAIEIVDLCDENNWGSLDIEANSIIRDPLVVAIEAGQLKMLKHLLDNKKLMPSNETGSNNHLMRCAEYGNWSAFILLLQHQAYENIDVTTLTNLLEQNLLMVAALNGKFYFADRFINKFGVDCLYNDNDSTDNKYLTDCSGDTILHLACQSQHIHLVHLIKKHINIPFDVKNDDDETPLHIVANDIDTEEDRDEDRYTRNFIIELAEKYVDEHILDIKSGDDNMTVRDMLPKNIERITTYRK